MLNFNYRPGMRAFKTCVAIFLGMIISIALKRENAFYVLIAAVICMQSTYKDTVRAGVDRVVGTFIGGVFGFLFLVIGPYLHTERNFVLILVLPAFAFIIIYICNIFDMRNAVAMGCVVFLIIATQDDVGSSVSVVLIYVVNRIFDTFMGIIIAALVNRYLDFGVRTPHDGE